MKKLHEIIAPLEEWEEQNSEEQADRDSGMQNITASESEIGANQTNGPISDVGDENQLRHVVTELLAGILAFGILCELAGIWFVRDKFGYSVGLFTGVILAAAMAAHMAWSLDRALELPQEDAQKKIRANSICRYLVIVVVLGIIMYTGIANPLACFLGIMSLKVAAYLQPFTHKYLHRKYKNEEEPS